MTPVLPTLTVSNRKHLFPNTLYNVTAYHNSVDSWPHNSAKCLTAFNREHAVLYITGA